MKYAILIREFFRTLFGSRYVSQLEKDIDEMRKERDYFRAETQRLMLFTQQRPQPARPDWREIPPAGAKLVGGRKTWAEIQRDWREEQQKQKESANVQGN